MADRRSGADGNRAKRQKTDSEERDPRSNPYLAHMYEAQDGEHSNGYSTPPRRLNGTSGGGAFAGFKRHNTTAALAKKAEDAENNPFTGRPFSSTYFSILKTRRDLPVHAQR